MCGRYTLFSQVSLQKRFATANDPKPNPRWNVAPGQAMPVITQRSPNKVEVMNWGLIPSWAKDPKIGYKMINAKAETAAEKPSFRAALKRRRCLVPSSGFYEWKHEDGGKVPMFIRLKDEELFSFAGLYEHWQDAHGNEIDSYTILTTSPNPLMAQIHDRMPVLLKNTDEDEWLDCSDEASAVRVQRLLVPYDEARMEAWPVSDRVNSPRFDGPELVARAAKEPSAQGGPNPR
jgi:putative SOS response-associated peptidase YedK